MRKVILLLFAVLAAVFTVFLPSGSEAGILTESSGRAPACISCHSVSAMGLERGYLASDISGFIDDFGVEGAVDFLTDIPIEAMAAAYAANPLTESDIEGLAADFAEGSRMSLFSHVAAGAVIAAVLTLFMRFVFRQRGGRK